MRHDDRPTICRQVGAKPRWRTVAREDTLLAGNGAPTAWGERRVYHFESS